MNILSSPFCQMTKSKLSSFISSKYQFTNLKAIIITQQNNKLNSKI